MDGFAGEFVRISESKTDFSDGKFERHIFDIIINYYPAITVELT